MSENNVTFDKDARASVETLSVDELCRYDMTKDIQRVIQVEMPSLSSIIESGSVPNDFSDTDYDNLDDTDHIVGLVVDEFDAIEASKALRSYKSAKAKLSAAQKEIAPTPPAPVPLQS